MPVYISLFTLLFLLIAYIAKSKLGVFIQNRKALLSFLIVGIIGLTLTYFSGNRLLREFDRHQWPQMDAVVLDSQVGGQRAYHPVIIYSYTFAGTEYRNTTSLDAPGFGTKNARRDTATRIVADYIPGDSIRIFVNPKKPAESYIRTGPYWSDFIQLSTGLLFYAFGLLIVVAYIFNRKSRIQDLR